jgi:hypothetical protein
VTAAFAKTFAPILTVVFALSTLTTSSQSAMLSGQVTDSSGATIDSVKIQFYKHGITVFSNHAGKFRVELQKDLNDSLIVSHRFLGTTTVTVSLKESETKHINIKLPKSCEAARASNTCPVCRSNKDVIPIQYGLPTPETRKNAKRGLVHLGGCIIFPCAPRHFCKKDGLEF